MHSQIAGRRQIRWPRTAGFGGATAGAIPLLVALFAFDGSPQTTPPGTATPPGTDAASCELPLAFVANRGQWPEAARFVARGHGFAARFERDAIVLELGSDRAETRGRGLVARLDFEGADPATIVEGIGLQRGVHHFFVGSDPSAWRTGVPAYSQILYRALRPGIDVRMREADHRLEYDVELAAGADLSTFVVHCTGIDEVTVEPDGALVLSTALGAIRSPPPTTWQRGDAGTRTPVDCRFRRIDAARFGFEAPALDRSRALVIDPALDWSTFLGGSVVDELSAVAVEPSGLVDACGSSGSLDFPTTPGAYSTSRTGATDAVIVRLDPTQTGSAQLLWSTYFGGSGSDAARSIAVDGNGVVTIAGETDSQNLPTTTGAFSGTLAGATDGFVARFDPSQSGAAQLLWSTYFGGTGDDTARIGYGGVAAGGVVTIDGVTASSDLPTTAGAFATTFAGGARDHFVARLDPSQAGSAQLLYSTFLGGSGDEGADPPSLAVDAAGDVTVGGGTASTDFPTTSGAFDVTAGGGSDGYVARLRPASLGAADLLAATYLGGAKDDAVLSLRLDATGAVVVTGSTASADFPTTAGAFDTTVPFPINDVDAFVARLDPGLGTSALLYSSYLGGARGTDFGSAVAITATDEVVITGYSASLSFPTSKGCFKSGLWGFSDEFVVKMRLAGAGTADLVYSTYFGGTSVETPAADGGVALDSLDNPVFVGQTISADFPTSPGAFQTALSGPSDGYLSMLCLATYRSYGAGWPGTKGIPLLTTRGDPILGSTLTLDLIDSRNKTTDGLLLVGWSDANSVTSAGGTLLVTPTSFVPIHLTAKSTAISGLLPSSDKLCGESIYVQALEVDPGATQGISFTAGLRLILGH